MPPLHSEIRNKVLFLGFLLCLSFYTYGQNNEFKFEKISVKDGLSHSNVYTIIQDNLGYMWFGTQDGLDKYDGYKFTTYRHSSQDTNSLSSSNFGKIYQDSSGIFWFGTFGGGLDRYDPKTNTFTNFSYYPNDTNCLSSNQIFFVFEDSQSKLWIGTANGGLNKFNKKTQKFTRYLAIDNNPKSFSSLRAKCICETSDGTIWIGSGDGLNKYNRNTDDFTVYQHDPKNKNSLSSNSIQHLFVDENDIIWIASRESGMTKFNPKTNTFKHYQHNPNNPNSISDNNVEFILKDSYGILWIGTYQGGLNRFDPVTEEFTKFIHDQNNIESISHNRIEYLYEDASKNLWIATRGGGINKLNLKPQKFYNILHDPQNSNSLPHPSVMAIDSDKNGNLWIGTDGGGLSRYNPQTGKYLHLQNDPLNKNSIASNRIWSVLIDKKGIIWAGTYRNGLSRIEYKDGKYIFNHYTKNIKEKGLSDNQINTIVEDQNGEIWIATSDGLNKLIKSDNPNNYTFKHYYHNPNSTNNFADNYISNLFLDSHGRYWVGSYTGGLYQFIPEEEKFVRYSPSDFENSELKKEIRVLIIFEDHNNNLLLGTESSGVIKFNFEDKNFSVLTNNKDLTDNMIIGMLEDDLSNLWITTSRGLYKYSTLNKSANKYSFVDGLESSGFNRNAVLKCTNGNMYIGSNLALTYFNPLEVSNNPYPPRIIITDFKILNNSQWENYLSPYTKYLDKNRMINLTQQDYVFTIEFAATDYTVPFQNQYKYKLEGFDQDWIDSKNYRSATYTNLNPGTYIFKVTGSNNDKIWNKEPAELVIKVIPPFYQKWWFIILISILSIIIIISYIKIREKNLIVKNEILENKIKERTVKINNQKEELRSQAEHLEKINKKLSNQQEHLEKLVHERTQDLEIAKEKAEESDRLKSSFLANMSHEIRTPMNAIIGFSNLMDDETVERENKAELTSLIKKNSNTLLNLIDDIIDIAKIESNQLEITKKNCFINAIFKDLLLDFEEIINSNPNVTVKIQEPQLFNKVEIFTDPFRLQQVLKHLISNALKFTEKGVIEFGYEMIHAKSNEIKFYVKDTGIGLSQEQQTQIFSRFTKIENNKKKIYRGAGLGLTITKNLVEMLGGKMIVESEVNKGSTFYFTLPYHKIEIKEKTQDQSKPANAKFNWSNKSILVAEDEESNFKFLQMVIRKTGAKIIWAKTGKQAIQMCKNNNIDLILMDIKMPEMDGLEAIKEIRKHDSKISIIVQSAFSMPEDRNLSFDAGANDFISKPIGTEKLLRVIDKQLNE